MNEELEDEVRRLRRSINRLTKQIADHDDLAMELHEFGKGPPGDRGPMGEPGRKGPDGPRGPEGPAGAGADGDNSGGARFWEGYLVRYLAGTFVGAVGVAVLFAEAPFLRESDWAREFADQLLSAAGADVIATFLIVLITLGFAFNYIASAPAYLIHLYRCYIISDVPTQKTWSSWGLGLFGVISTYSLIGILAVTWDKAAHYAATIVITTFVLSVIAGILPFLALKGGASTIGGFYHALSRKRAIGTSSLDSDADTDDMRIKATRREYVESYRHLREHGNAYFIVILNILLVCILSIAQSIQQVALIISFWTLPAALGWFAGTALENKI